MAIQHRLGYGGTPLPTTSQDNRYLPQAFRSMVPTRRYETGADFRRAVGALPNYAPIAENFDWSGAYGDLGQRASNLTSDSTWNTALSNAGASANDLVKGMLLFSQQSPNPVLSGLYTALSNTQTGGVDSTSPYLHPKALAPGAGELQTLRMIRNDPEAMRLYDIRERVMRERAKLTDKGWGELFGGPGAGIAGILATPAGPIVSGVLSSAGRAT